jgi:type III restriction enzyme
MIKRKTVLKRGTESDEAFCKRVLKEFGDAKNILVINDEAHHCWRVTEKDG